VRVQVCMRVSVHYGCVGAFGGEMLCGPTWRMEKS